MCAAPSMLCGDGVVDGGEQCDVAIASGIGSCPIACDDADACTADSLSGSECTSICAHVDITDAMSGDGCCPAQANANTDSDCIPTCGNGIVEQGEVCDSGIASGIGSCPSACVDQDACTTDVLMNSGTCEATCSNATITSFVDNDGCCPAGADVYTDADCIPRCSDGGTMRAAVLPNVGDLIITEFMPRPSAVGATVGQWVEVKALASVDLNEVALDRANDSAGPAIITNTDCIHLDAGQYAVVARSSDPAMNGGITTVGTFSFSINPTSNADLQIVVDGTVIDAVTWSSSTSARSKSLDPDFQTATANDDQATFCDGQTIYNSPDYGTPGAANDQCGALVPPGQCDDNGTPRPIVKPTIGNLVITEFLANPAGTASGSDAAQEWFEIKNVGATAFDLNELSMKGNGLTTYPVQANVCKSVPAGSYALFAHSTDSAVNGGLPSVDATFTFALANSTGAISLLDGTTVLDAISWPSATYAPDGKARQLDPTMTNTTANDDHLKFCTALVTQTYGTAGNVGTPKTANACQ
jgi:Lamin Tail Domain